MKKEGAKGMKKPEEIKKGLECCRPRDKRCECPYYGEDWCSSNKNDAALSLIRQLEAQVPKWISVEERMADEETIALVFGRGEVSKGTLIEYLPRVHVAFTRNGEWILYDSGELVHATHWMPLPESPEEEEK
jgi:hypothetical protein